MPGQKYMISKSTLELEDAALLLNYMEGHDYAIGTDAEGKMYRQDMAEENGEIEPFPIEM